MIEGLFLLILWLAVLYFSVYFTLWIVILLPARMAEARGRSAFGWVLISIIFSPILACLLLWLLGDSPDRRTYSTRD